MKMIQVFVVTVCLLALVGCGGSTQEDIAADSKTQVVEPTPVFTDNFESGEAEGWTEDGETKPESQAAEEAPAE